MRARARKELSKSEGENNSDKIDPKEDKVPSFFSGMMIILFGSLTFSIFYTAGNTLVGILASAPFILIGMSRISKNTAGKAKANTLSEKIS